MPCPERDKTDSPTTHLVGSPADHSRDGVFFFDYSPSCRIPTPLLPPSSARAWGAVQFPLTPSSRARPPQLPEIRPTLLTRRNPTSFTGTIILARTSLATVTTTTIATPHTERTSTNYSDSHPELKLAVTINAKSLRPRHPLRVLPAVVPTCAGRVSSKIRIRKRR